MKKNGLHLLRFGMHAIAAAVLGSTALGAGACVLAVGEQDGQLGSIGGAEDAPAFVGYQFHLLDDGSLAVHDPVKSKILVYGRSADGSLDCSRTLQSMEILGPQISSTVLANGKVYGLDAIGRMRLLFPREPMRRLGESMGTGSAPPVPTQAIAAAFGSDMPLQAGRATWIARPSANAASDVKTGEISLSIDGNKLGNIPHGIINSGGAEYRHALAWESDRKARLEIWRKGEEDQAIKLQVKTPNHLGAVDLLRIGASGFVVAVEDFSLNSQAAIEVRDHVLTYARDGTLLSRKVLSQSSGVRASWVPISQALALDPVRKSVLYYTVRQGDEIRMETFNLDTITATELEPQSNTDELTSGGTPLQRKRAAILKRADEFITVAWPAKSANLNDNNSHWNCVAPYDTNNRRWAKPIFLRNVQAGQTIYGVPYEWGGKSSVATFLRKVRSGAIAGNVCTKVVHGAAVTVPNTSGVDCSGLVSRAWNVKDSAGRDMGLSTTAIATDRYSRRISRLSDLMPGDALNKAGNHVRLFAGWVRTPFGLRIRAYESTTDSVCSGSCLRDLRVRAYAGYSPRGTL